MKRLEWRDDHGDEFEIHSDTSKFAEIILTEQNLPHSAEVYVNEMQAMALIEWLQKRLEERAIEFDREKAPNG